MFYQAFIDKGGILPFEFKVEKSGIGDLSDVFAEALSPTVTICWRDDDITKKYGITNSEDIRIVFAFDN